MSSYRILVLNIVAGIAIMYVVMFAMIDGLGDFYNNLNTLWMAVAMAAPMGTLMLLTMGSMYPSRPLNLVFHLVLAVLFVAGFAFVRTQAFIGDEQFLRSMIPHHSGAILMCREAAVADPEIVALCGTIARSQQDEIGQMRAILARL